jgi:hypothetical protein
VDPVRVADLMDAELQAVSIWHARWQTGGTNGLRSCELHVERQRDLLEVSLPP